MDAFLPVYDSVKLRSGHVENICALSYADLSNVDVLHSRNLLKLHFLNNTTDLKRTVHLGGSYQVHKDK